MSKPSLIDFIISHGAESKKVVTKMSSDDIKNSLSDHFCNACCLYSMFEGCVQVKSTLDSNVPSENKVEQDDILLISILSHLLPKIKLRPLRRLLTNIRFYFHHS